MANQEANTPQRQGLGEIESAARNLVTLLLSSVSTDMQAAEPERPGPSETVQRPGPSETVQRPGPSVTVQRPGPSVSVQEEMARSFPGYFRPSIKRGKKRALPVPKQSKLSKVISLNFYLLPKNTSITPLPNEELELLQAGMGRRTVSISEDSDHAEISRILTQTYPKMEGLSGGWLLHKATGGSGRRKLVIIPPEAEGYSAKALKSVSSGGKAIFYIVPLQESLDTSPLAPDSPHFSKMPKTTCYQCSEVMPLQMLAVHIKTCIGKLSFDEDQTSEDVWVVEDESKVSCPICYREFMKEDITLHASVCGESLCTVTSAATCADEVIPVHTPACTPKSLEEVLTFLKEQVDTTTEFKLCVDREYLPERGIIQWKRKKMASPVSLLKVVFIGESGIDTGALRKEFLTDMISGIETRFFEGAGSQGKNPKYSLTDLDDETFRIVGEIFAVSLAQGGPAPAFLREWCYNFLCAGEVNFSFLSKEDVMDLESSLLICRVEDATDTESLMMLADEIVSCGYTSQINHEQKESIIRAIVLHSTTRLIPILQQLQSGMQLYGLVDQLSKNPELCKPLFVPGKITKPDADFIMMNCQPLYSEKGTSKERIERKVTNFLQDFLQELEVSVDAPIADDGDTVLGDTQPLFVQKVLQWMTGQSHIPILPDEKRRFKIACHFDHDCIERLGNHSVCYPVVSACTCTVTFPVKHLSTYQEFKRIMSDAVRYGGGFFRV